MTGEEPVFFFEEDASIEVRSAHEVSMADRASDIGDLEEMYVNGEASDDCARKAMLIAVRIRTERAFAGSRTDVSRLLELTKEVERFHAVLAKIRGRDASRDVLHLYEQFLNEQGITL